MADTKNYYFISDFHLGAPDREKSLVREKKIVRWLDLIKADVAEIFILGDVFDFWFEYSTVIPRGYVRLLGKLAELSDSGVQIHWFIGNHDMWIFDYIPTELNIDIIRQPIRRKIRNHTFYIGHGDGLGPGTMDISLLKKFFGLQSPNGFLRGVIQISALVWPIIFRDQAEKPIRKPTRYFWEKKKSGWPFTPKKNVQRNTLTFLFLVTDICLWLSNSIVGVHILTLVIGSLISHTVFMMVPTLN